MAFSGLLIAIGRITGRTCHRLMAFGFAQMAIRSPLVVSASTPETCHAPEGLVACSARAIAAARW